VDPWIMPEANEEDLAYIVADGASYVFLTGDIYFEGEG
jgi:hypothetical protein